MPHLITCLYVPDGDRARLPIRDQHLEYIIANIAHIPYAGAIANADDLDDTRAIGMFIAHESDDVQVARAFMAAEPYHRHGLFASVQYQRLRQFIPHAQPDFLLSELMRERARLAASGTGPDR